MQLFFLLAIPVLLVYLPTHGEQQKRNVAVVDFEGRGISEGEAKTLSDKLRGELLATDSFAVIERSQMNEVLKEQGFQQTGCTSQECMVEIGQLIGVSKIMAGSVGKVGETFLISVRMVDVKTGRIEKGVEEEIEGKIDDVLRKGIRSVARKMAGLKAEKLSKPVVPAATLPPPKSAPDTVFVKKLVGSISAQVKPENLEVFVNARSYGKGSMLIESLPVGKYEVSARENGKTRVKKAVIVKPNQIANVELKVSNWRAFVLSPQISRGAVEGEGMIGWMTDLGFKYRPVYFGGNFGLGLYQHYTYGEVDSSKFLDPRYLNDSIYSARLPNKWIGGGLTVLYEGLNLKDVMILGLGWNAGFWKMQFRDESYVDTTVSPPTLSYDYQYSSKDYFGGPRLRFLLGYKHFFLSTNYFLLLGSPKVHFVNSGFVLSF